MLLYGHLAVLIRSSRCDAAFAVQSSWLCALQLYYGSLLKIKTVSGLLLVQYAVFFYDYFKEWRKNPQWSCSCCLAFLLPLNDLRGEIGGLVETNVLKNPLKTGNLEIPTLFATVKDTGVIDVSLDEGDRHDVNMKDLRADSCEAATCIKRKCNRCTQTEIQSLFPIFDAMDRDAMETTHF